MRAGLFSVCRNGDRSVLNGDVAAIGECVDRVLGADHGDGGVRRLDDQACRRAPGVGRELRRGRVSSAAARRDRRRTK